MGIILVLGQNCILPLLHFAKYNGYLHFDYSILCIASEIRNPMSQ